MKILFLCMGNTCRSPMAEYIARHEAEKRGFDIETVSAGLMGSGDRAADYSVAVCREIGLDLSAHRSRMLSKPLADSADLIVCMTPAHANTLLTLGIDKSKIRVLGSGIADPYGQSLDVYRQCRNEIYSAVCALLDGTCGEINIVPLQKEHAARLAELEKMCFSDPWSEEGIAFEAENDAARFFVALCGEEIAGYAGMLYAADLGNICNIAVFPQYRRHGVGRKLVYALIDSATELGVFELTLEVRESNEPAKALYRSFGFEEVGRRKNFYNDPAEDAIVMNLSL